MSIITERASCKTTRVQSVEDVPVLLATIFMRGYRRKSGTNIDMPSWKTRFWPHQPTNLAKKRAWKIPSITPKEPRIMPMVEGGKPRPPRETGVEKKRGWTAR